MQLIPLQSKYTLLLYQIHLLITWFKYIEFIINHTSESYNIANKKEFSSNDHKPNHSINRDYDAYANIGNNTNDSVEMSNANGAMSAAFRVAFNDSLKFDGKKLTRFDDDGNVVAEYPALSGRPSKVINKAGKKYKTKDYTTPENQGEIGLGPIPEGNYVALQSDFQEISTKDKVLGSIGRGAWPGGAYSWGESRVWLTPTPGNDALFRGGFSIHGGTVFGSAGCVDLCTSMSRFSQDFKDYGKDILLRVDYSEQK